MGAAILTTQEAEEAKVTLVTASAKGMQAVYETVVALRANSRSGSANTKSKGDVSLSGTKSWRQKGTGRARTGYRSSPIWRGGGVVFGPKPRSFLKKIPKRTKRLALRKAFSVRLLEGDVLIVDSFQVAEPKTKQFLALLRESVSQTHAKVLIIDAMFNTITVRAARNVQKALLILAREVHTAHLLSFDKILLTRAALNVIATRLSK
ncbi:MAG: 50S ribosomal protein L4 [Candidatus Xiphinematobacter sp.]|nr:MAG: 50S ribosomal protein L4 [Candidatus Xiphinematobacter sp.]